jgi:hypothetical protein
VSPEAALRHPVLADAGLPDLEGNP